MYRYAVETAGARNLQPATILLAEDAVLPSVRMGALVLFPQQQSGDAAAALLRMQVGEVRPRCA